MKTKNYGKCECAFEHSHTYDSYVCDVDAQAITLNRLSEFYPPKKILIQEPF